MTFNISKFQDNSGFGHRNRMKHLRIMDQAAGPDGTTAFVGGIARLIVFTLVAVSSEEYVWQQGKCMHLN